MARTHGCKAAVGDNVDDVVNFLSNGVGGRGTVVEWRRSEPINDNLRALRNGRKAGGGGGCWSEMVVVGIAASLPPILIFADAFIECFCRRRGPEAFTANRNERAVRAKAILET